MSSREIDIKKIIAIVLLVLEVIAILFVGHLRVENELFHYVTAFTPRYTLYMTFNKDIQLDDFEGEVIAPKGSVVLVTTIGNNNVEGYFSKTGRDFDVLKKMDYESMEATLKDFICFNLPWDCFEEQTKIQELYSEQDLIVEAKKKDAKSKLYVSTVFTAVFCLLVGILLIFLLSRKEWYLLLYVLEVIALLITIFILPSVFLY